MTFLDKLKSHVGGLIRIKTELFWYKDRDYDNISNLICLLVDVNTNFDEPPDLIVATWLRDRQGLGSGAVALVMIDADLQLIWVNNDDVEFIE